MNRSTWSLILLLAAPSSLPAGLVYINSPLASVESVQYTEAAAKYRLSHTNFDQSLSRGAATSAGTFISAGLGNVPQLSHRTYDFVFQHLPGQGFVFTMSWGGDSVLSWGTFPAPPGGTHATTLAGQPPGRPFNALELNARASQGGSEMRFGGFTFSSPTLSVADGAFRNGSVTPSTGNPLGFDIQWLVADTNLAQHEWTLRGSVTAVKSATGGDETVRFQVNASQVSADIAARLGDVPEPGTFLLLGIGLLVVGLAGRVSATAGPRPDPSPPDRPHSVRPASGAGRTPELLPTLRTGC